MDKIKKIGIPIYIVWSCISLLAIAFIIIVNFCFEKPKTSGYEYFNGVRVDFDAGDVDGNVLPIFELNIARSATNPALNITELVITEYTDINHTTFKRYGIQVIGKVSYSCPAGKSLDVDEPYPRGYLSNAYFYEIADNGEVINQSYDSIYSALHDKKLDVTVGTGSDITNYQLQVGGADATYTYIHEEYSTKGWNAWNRFFERTKDVTITNEYNVYDLAGYLMKTFETSKERDGTYIKYFPNLELDKYLTITKDNGNGQFYSLKDFDTNNAYFMVKCTYRPINDNLRISDSIIGCIKGSETYNSGVSSNKTQHYYDSVELTLSGYDFIYYYNASLEGYMIAVSDSFKTYLQSLNDVTINVIINLDNFTFEDRVIGLDANSFNNLKIKNLVIATSETTNFYISGKLRNVEEFSYSNTITLLNATTGGAYD